MMTQKDGKIAKTFRLSKKTTAILKQYAEEEGITQTQAVENAISALEKNNLRPATADDIERLTEKIGAGQLLIMEEIRLRTERKPLGERLKRYLTGE